MINSINGVVSLVSHSFTVAASFLIGTGYYK